MIHAPMFLALLQPSTRRKSTTTYTRLNENLQTSLQLCVEIQLDQRKSAGFSLGMVKSLDLIASALFTFPR